MEGLGWFVLATLAGGLGRWALAAAINRAAPGFPFGTLAVNLLGCAVIGAADALAQDRLGAAARLAIITGFCGAFTTFSSLILETEHLLRAGQLGRAGMNVAASLVLGLVCFRGGAGLISRF
ncbi:MAG: CrcB family protein [Elusimicrobia bacterium]|nr:CrcB family protein [Elusimicrobiota bacterium]